MNYQVLGHLTVVAMGEVVWPHQLAQSKGGKLGFKLVFEMYNIFLCSDTPKLLRQIEVNSV